MSLRVVKASLLIANTALRQLDQDHIGIFFS